jgi:hypothetical protein
MHDACYWCQGDRRNSICLLAFCLHVRDGEFCLWRLATATSADWTSSSDVVDQAARQHQEWRWWLASTARRRNTSTVTTYPCRILSRAEHARHGVDLRLQDTAGWPERLYSTRSRPWAPPMTGRHLRWGHDGVCSRGLPGNRKEAKREHHRSENLREVETDRARCVAHIHGRLFDPVAASLQRRNDREGDRTTAAVKFLVMVLRRTEGRAQTCESREAIPVHGVDVGCTGRSRRWLVAARIDELGRRRFDES